MRDSFSTVSNSEVDKRPYNGTAASVNEVSESLGKTNYSTKSNRTWWRPSLAPDTAPRGRERESSRGKRVLIVEDETYLCDLISDILEAEGHSTRSAANGRVALEKLRDYTPDLILLDLMMPVMDGWELMRTMRTDPRLAAIPVVIISAMYDLKRLKQDIGAKAVLTKPFDIDQLAEAVNAYAA